MLDLFGKNIVGFPTRRLKCKSFMALEMKKGLYFGHVMTDFVEVGTLDQ